MTAHLFYATFRANDRQGTVTLPIIDTDVKAALTHLAAAGYGKPLSIELIGSQPALRK